MSLVHAVIIAGGQGQRLGGIRKADIRIGGVRLIERVANRLDQSTKPILVATGPSGKTIALGDQFFGIDDIEGSGGGPLAGLAAAVLYLRSRGITTGTLISVAVDTPFLPHDYIDRLLGALPQAPSAFSGWGEAFYPPNAAWRLEAIADLHQTASAIGSLKALHRQLGGQKIGWDDAVENPFDNLNTVADLVSLGHRANRMTLL